MVLFLNLQGSKKTSKKEKKLLLSLSLTQALLLACSMGLSAPAG
jgi:hypothetical protein